MSKGIRKEAFYPDSPERVWVVLTDPRAIAEWLMPNNFLPVVGHRFYFMVDPMPGLEERTDCEVLEVDPPRRLAYSWLIKWRREYKRPPQPMIVSWTLTPERGGTRLVFEQTPYVGPRKIFTVVSMNIGWSLMHRKLIPKVLARVSAEAEFSPGAIPIDKRHYKARTVPAELVK